MISYYELLKLIKENKYPELIELNLNCGSKIYQAYYDNCEFSHYALKDENDNNENFKYYLVDSLLENEMFDKNIKIIEIQEENNIRKITINENGTIGFPNGCWTARNMDKAFAIKINELIDKVNELNGS